MVNNCVRKLDDPKYWGWIVVVADFVCIFLTIGLMRSVGVLYAEWMDYFEEDSSLISSLSSLTSSLSALTGKLH